MCHHPVTWAGRELAGKEPPGREPAGGGGNGGGGDSVQHWLFLYRMAVARCAKDGSDGSDVTEDRLDRRLNAAAS